MNAVQPSVMEDPEERAHRWRWAKVGAMVRAVGAGQMHPIRSPGR